VPLGWDGLGCPWCVWLLGGFVYVAAGNMCNDRWPLVSLSTLWDFRLELQVANVQQAALICACAQLRSITSHGGDDHSTF
jgi:anaerobic glycerol-3-phosphate dehydrogenase